MAGRQLGEDALVRSWVRSMRARNLAETTVTHYTSSVDQLLMHARARGHDPLTREAIEEYLGTLTQERKPATVSFRHRALQQFTKRREHTGAGMVRRQGLRGRNAARPASHVTVDGRRQPTPSTNRDCPTVTIVEIPT